MSRTFSRLTPPVLLALTLVLVEPGLAGKGKRQTKVDKWPDVDLSAYSVLCIEEFEMTDPKASRRKRQVDVRSAPRRLARYVEELLEPDLFEQVMRGPVEEPPPGTVILAGEITQYKPGSRTGRAMMAGAGSAHMDFTARLVDAASSEELVEFGGKKTWAWGGLMGASKGVGDLEANLARELVLYLYESKTGETM